MITKTKKEKIKKTIINIISSARFVFFTYFLGVFSITKIILINNGNFIGYINIIASLILVIGSYFYFNMFGFAVCDKIKHKEDGIYCFYRKIVNFTSYLLIGIIFVIFAIIISEGMNIIISSHRWNIIRIDQTKKNKRTGRPFFFSLSKLRLHSFSLLVKKFIFTPSIKSMYKWVKVEKYRWEFEKILSQIIEEKEKWRKYVEAQDEAYFQAVENWCPNPWINSLIF